MHQIRMQDGLQRARCATGFGASFGASFGGGLFQQRAPAHPVAVTEHDAAGNGRKPEQARDSEPVTPVQKQDIASLVECDLDFVAAADRGGIRRRAEGLQQWAVRSLDAPGNLLLEQETMRLHRPVECLDIVLEAPQQGLGAGAFPHRAAGADLRGCMSIERGFLPAAPLHEDHLEGPEHAPRLERRAAADRGAIDHLVEAVDLSPVGLAEKRRPAGAEINRTVGGDVKQVHGLSRSCRPRLSRRRDRRSGRRARRDRRAAARAARTRGPRPPSR